MSPLEEAIRLFGLQPPHERPVRIAIVDSGVYAEHPHVLRVAGGISLLPGTAPDDYVDRNGHGTAVAAAIREKAPGADLIAVKVFDRQLATSARELASAIEWAAGQRVDLINLSLGTTNPAHADLLQGAVAAARAAGAAVVAASDQVGIPSLPGALEGVISVGLDWDLERDDVIVEIAGPDVIRLHASGYPRPIPGVPPEKNLSGISFAVANATGLIGRELGRIAQGGQGDQQGGQGGQGG